MLKYWNATLLTFHFPGAMLHNFVPKFHAHLEAVTQRCSVKKVILEILENSQENASLCASVLLRILRSFYTFFYRTTPVASSAHFLK